MKKYVRAALIICNLLSLQIKKAIIIYNKEGEQWWNKLVENIKFGIINESEKRLVSVSKVLLLKFRPMIRIITSSDQVNRILNIRM